MRRIVLSLVLLLVLPAFVSAQERLSDEAADFFQAEVQAPSPTTSSVPLVAGETELTDLDVPVDATEEATADEPLAPQEDIGNRSWWYLVGAIVAAGIVLAVVL